MQSGQSPRRVVTALAAALSLTPPTIVCAYRPFISTDAAVADVGEAEVEFGYAGFREAHHRVTFVAPTLTGNLGIARDVEVVGEFKLAHDLGRSSDEDRTRFEDSGLSVKWVLREGVLQDTGKQPSLALELSMLLPTFRGEDRPGGELTALVSARTRGWTYHLNAGALVEPGGSEPGVVWGFIAEHTVRGPLRVVAEINGESVRTRRADNSVLLGAVWSAMAPAPLHQLSFDVGVRRGLSDASERWGGTAGLTFAFPVGRLTTEENTP